VALNLAYTSIPQLGRAIRLSVSQNLNLQINKLKVKTGDAQVKLTTINESSVAEETKLIRTQELKEEEKQTDRLLNNVVVDVDVANNKISSRMSLYFFTASIMSIVFLYLIGITPLLLTEEGNKFPIEALFYTYLIFLIILVTIAGWKYFNGDFYQKGFVGIVFLVFVLTSISYGTDLCTYLSKLNYSELLIINIMLITTVLPLLITIPQYIYSSIKISKRYSAMLAKQEEDLTEIIASISDASTSPKSLDTINKIKNAPKLNN